MSPDISYGTPVTLMIPLNCFPTLGFIVHMDDTTGQLIVKGCQAGSYCHRIPRWRSMIRNSVVRSVNSTRVRFRAHTVELIKATRSQGLHQVELIFAKIAVRTDTDDQLRHLNELYIALRDPVNEVLDAFLNFTRAQLRKCPDYAQWHKSEWQQHD